MQHTVLYISLPLFCTTTTPNFQKLFYGGNVVVALVHFFFTTSHFFLTLVAASISHFVTAGTKFSCCSFIRKCLLCFLSLALDLCRPFSRWVSLACRPLSLFLCLSLALYSRLPITRTLANSNQNRFPLDFRHTFTVILPSVTRTLDNSNSR